MTYVSSIPKRLFPCTWRSTGLDSDQHIRISLNVNTGEIIWIRLDKSNAQRLSETIQEFIGEADVYHGRSMEDSFSRMDAAIASIQQTIETINQDNTINQPTPALDNQTDPHPNTSTNDSQSEDHT